jgi:hypothetical protein
VGEVAVDLPSFNELLDLLRIRLRDADALNVSQLHSFRELMRHEAESDLIADGWHWEAFEELELLGHLDPASHRALGGDAYGRLSADGREHLRTIDNHS